MTPCKKGYTLVELAVSMAVAGLCATLAMGAWFHFRIASLQREAKYQQALERESKLQALQRKLGHGAVLVLAEAERLEWRNPSGDRTVLQWGDSITLDSKRFLDHRYTLSYTLDGLEGSTHELSQARLLRLVLHDSTGMRWVAELRTK